MAFDFDKVRLDAQEHYILANLKTRLPQYILMWIIAVGLAIVARFLPVSLPVSGTDELQMASRAFLSISVVTVTFAIPTCMRTIFSAYEQYYSTKIREILLERFPVVLLALSAFTSLIVSLLSISGVAGKIIPIDAVFIFYIELFWSLVCVGYLFVAIEKLIYFVVRAPFAVLDKLEYHIDAESAAKSNEGYAEFRREISSLNDIAATILAKSTGRDEAVTSTLDFFRSTHARYLEAQSGEDAASAKRRRNACRALDHEIVRVFREACNAKNEQACRRVMKTYSMMISDAGKSSCSDGYFSDMLAQLERMRSYGQASKIEEVEYLAGFGWFFMLAAEAGEEAFSSEKRASIARRLSASLRDATLAGSDNAIAKFLRTASNADPEYDIELLSPAWQLLLDRGVLVYLAWLLDAMPSGVEGYLSDIARYSAVDAEGYRKVLPSTAGRVKGLFLSETMDAPAGAFPSSEQTAMLMGMTREGGAAHTLAMMCVLRCAGVKVSSLSDMGHQGTRLLSEITTLASEETDEQLNKMMEMATIVDSSLDEQLSAARALSNTQSFSSEN